MTDNICERCGEEYGFSIGPALDGQFAGHNALTRTCGCPETTASELQLLVIDLGDSCVVKVEKGPMVPLVANIPYNGIDPCTFLCSFAELRTAIDSDKPVPRIEHDFRGYHFFPYDEHRDCRSFVWSANDYKALCQLAGVTIPIWEGNGTWTQLLGKDGIRFSMDETVKVKDMYPCDIWRYTR